MPQFWAMLSHAPAGGCMLGGIEGIACEQSTWQNPVAQYTFVLESQPPLSHSIRHEPWQLIVVLLQAPSPEQRMVHGPFGGHSRVFPLQGEPELPDGGLAGVQQSNSQAEPG
jgi:hypothetical protein